MPDNQKGDRGRQEPRTSSRFPVVGVGASAGGIEALERLFSSLPATSGLAFVIVQHLAPDRESLLPELLARVSNMPVEKARDGMRIEPDRAYVVPPNTAPTVEGGALRLRAPGPVHGQRNTIDLFLSSLAEDQGSSAVGVVLSGTGSDGTAGLQAIKKHGAFTIVQDPQDAKFDGMPQSAIDAGQADRVASIADMPDLLLEHARLVAGGGSTGARVSHERDDDVLHDRILSLLHERTGRDHQHYKHSTLHRRIQRRMEIEHVGPLAAYVDRLEATPEEVDRLADDLLIGVTQFFRDAEAFDTLDRIVLPALVERRMERPAGALRVWVAGCASGEEAYSIAILVHEHVSRLPASLPVQIFASDVDEQALDVARRGSYPKSIAENVTPERLARFFTETDAGYRICKEVRAMCVFSAHDILYDPPFSRLDLVSCRNVFIYFDTDAQERLLPVLHYALRQGGVLFLGPSETIGGHPELFRPIDKKYRLFERKEFVSSGALVLPPRGGAPLRPYEHAPRAAEPRTARQQMGDELRRLLVEEFGPGAALVTERGEILHVAGRTSAFLELTSGPFENDIHAMARGALRFELRTALSRAVRSREAVAVDGIPVQRDDRVVDVRLVVRPVAWPGTDTTLYMVVFQEKGARPADASERQARGDVVPGEILHELESELRRTKEDLQSTIREVEASNDELKSSNEELTSMNEELQSANEELQTSKEELQSVNEELQTVNAELGKKIEELNRTNDDLQNLMRSTQIATLFLDGDLRIKRYTPATVELFRLIESDVGRPITDISAPFADPTWIEDVREVLGTLAPRERSLRVGDGRAWYMMIVLPYRTVMNVIDGVVVTFVNVTELKRAQLRAAELAAIVESSQDAIVGQSSKGTITSWNRGATQLFGFTAEEMIGRSFTELTPKDLAGDAAAIRADITLGHAGNPIETIRLHKDGRLLHVSLTFSPRRDEEGQIIGVSVIGRDVTSHKQAEEDARRLQEELERTLADTRTILDVVPIGILIAHDPEASRVTGNAACASILGVSPDTNLGMTDPNAESLPFRLRRGDVDVPPSEHPLARAASRGAVVQAEQYDVVFRDGSTKYAVISAVPLKGAPGKSRGAVGVLADVTAQRRATMELETSSRHKDEFMAMLGHELRNPLAAMTGAYALVESHAGEEVKTRAMAVLGRQLRYLARLVDDLLDLSRVSRGKIELRREKLNLVETVRQVVEDYRAPYQTNGIRLDFDGASRPLWVLGDRVRLSQIVGNLLSNSLKFTRRGGAVELSLTEVPNSAELQITDTGIGIEAAALASIFEPFVQSGAPIGPVSGGLGLGLAVCKRIVEMHDGTIEARSDGPGRGATFVLRLPLLPDASRLLQGAPAESRTLLPRRVLVIEDSEDVAMVLGAWLEASGHVVEMAIDGRAGLVAGRRFLPDVILCDIGLPGDMDGYAVARAIRVDPELRGTYLVAVTGYARNVDRQRAKQAGFDVHVTKPIDYDELNRVLSTSERRA